MKTAVPNKQRKSKQPPAPPEPLERVGVAMTRGEIAIVSQLASIQADLTGRAISRSTVIRALVRLAREKITDQELCAAVELEINSGRKWGNDQIRRTRA